MSVRIVLDEPMDGREWDIKAPIMEGMGWHVVRLEDDCHTLTTLAVTDSEQSAINYITSRMTT